MKKILVLSMLLLAYASSSSAAAIATATASSPGIGIYGGDSSTNAGTAVNPLVRFSTGVRGAINFLAAGTPSVVTSYSLNTKHDIGSKVFGTANDSTKIYYKQAPSKIVLGDTGSEFGTVVGNTNYEAVGWTAY